MSYQFFPLYHLSYSLYSHFAVLNVCVSFFLLYFHSDSMPERIALICFLSLVMLMSVLGNLLVMVAVCKDRQLRWASAFSFHQHIIYFVSHMQELLPLKVQKHTC